MKIFNSVEYLKIVEIGPLPKQTTSLKHGSQRQGRTRKRKQMPMHRIQSVYTVVHDMDRAQAFYEQALELPMSFRDRSAWCQFKVGPTNFALSSPGEAAAGARGSVV